MKRYGYIRVSTKEQNPERQVLAMRAQEIEQSNIFATGCLVGIFHGRSI